MNNSLRHSALMFLFLCTAASPLFSQDMPPRPAMPGMELVRLEPVAFAMDSGQVRLDLLYRIRYDFFVFIRDTGTAQAGFTASGDIVVELLDSTDASIARQFKTISLHARDDAPASLRQTYAQGDLSYVLPAGHYTAVAKIVDGQSKREFFNTRQMVSVPAYHSQSHLRSSPLFVKALKTPLVDSKFTPLNLSNGVVFGEDAGVMVQIADASELKELHYSLSRFESSDVEKSLVQADTAVTYAVFPGSRISISAGDSTGVNAVLKKGPFTTVYIPFPASRWKQGRYELKAVLRTTDTASIVTEFTVRWLNMPSSLTNLDFAIAAMKYYLSEEEYDWLRSGGKAARIQKFEEFWKKKDPTPETAYNEFMAEYFRRVDIAFVQFRTIKEENGVATDRGRIYILYGPPTSIKRTLEPGKAPMEIWKYSASGKTFVFEDQSRQGDYTLISLSNK